MVSSASTGSTANGLRDHLTTVGEGEDAVNPLTGEVVTCYSGLVGYLIPTEGGPGESQFKIDISRPVEDLIDGNKLPGIWVLKPKSPQLYPNCMDDQEFIFRKVLISCVKANGSSNFLTQGFDTAISDSLEEGTYLPYVNLGIRDTVNALLFFQFFTACGLRHELTRLPATALDLSGDEGPVYPPATCPIRMQNGGCGHPEQTGLLWLLVRAIVLADKQDQASEFLTPVFDLMKQDALFGLMVQQGEQTYPMDSGGKSQQDAHSSRIKLNVGKLVELLKSKI